MVKELKEILAERGLKVTPQRLAIYEALMSSKEHPTAEMLIQELENKYPSISTGTVYRILETFVEKRLIKRVKSDKDIMRYDARTDTHHHLYCEKSNRISDYVDVELTELLENYFKNKHISGFDIKSIHVQIEGEFKQTT